MAHITYTVIINRRWWCRTWTSTTIAPNGNGNDGGNTLLVTPEGTFTAYGGGGGGGNGLGGDQGGSGGGAGGGGSAGTGNKKTGTGDPAQNSPPQPRTLTNVQGYNGGPATSPCGGGGGGAGGAAVTVPETGVVPVDVA